MTGRTAAIASWRALDREGEDRCRLSHADQGWLLVGHARFRDDDGFAALDYVVRCDEDWTTLSADVAGLHDGLEVNLRVQRNGKGWSLNDSAQPNLVGATDIDLSFTPATNLMPIRRLQEAAAGELTCRAAWLNYPEGTLSALDQAYVSAGTPGLMTYTAVQTDYTTQLITDRSGFVTLYPGLWEGEVTHAR